MLRSLLGWRCLPAGLAWWYENGKRDMGDPRLRLILDRWNTRGELDEFAAREWKMKGSTGSCDDDYHWDRDDYEPEAGWWEELRLKESPMEYGPYHGGTNPLHLSHSDPVGWAQHELPVNVHVDEATRSAYLVVKSFSSWRRELETLSRELPSLGPRSWHVEVFDREVGFLGKFRQSRVTGLWFQGKHSIHMAGNPHRG